MDDWVPGPPGKRVTFFVRPKKVNQRKAAPLRRPSGSFGLAGELGVCATRPSSLHKTQAAAELEQGAADTPQFACQAEAAQRGNGWRFYVRHPEKSSARCAWLCRTLPFKGRAWVGMGDGFDAESPRSTAELPPAIKHSREAHQIAMFHHIRRNARWLLRPTRAV